MIAGVCLFSIIPPFVIYVSILIEMYSKVFKKCSNTFAKYLYFHLNSFIKMYLYSVFVKLQSICTCIRKGLLWKVFDPGLVWVYNRL